MIVKLFDETEIIVSDKAAAKLKESLARDPQGYVTINNFTVKKTAIAVIKPSSEQAIEKNYKMIEAPDNRGKYSENKEKVRQMLIQKGLING